MLLASSDSSTVIAVIALIFSFLATLITFGIAIFNYIAVREMKRQGNALLKETKASVLQKCTESYIIIRRQKAMAIIEKSKVLAIDYYRAICDLYWSEFRLYSEDLVPRPIMGAWLYARKRDYVKGKIEFNDSTGNAITIRCEDVWKELLGDEYFLSNDPFVQFMDLAHRDKVEEALRIKDTGSQA